jgi:hypothetical protein
VIQVTFNIEGLNTRPVASALRAALADAFDGPWINGCDNAKVRIVDVIVLPDTHDVIHSPQTHNDPPAGNAGNGIDVDGAPGTERPGVHEVPLTDERAPAQVARTTGEGELRAAAGRLAKAAEDAGWYGLDNYSDRTVARIVLDPTYTNWKEELP